MQILFFTSMYIISLLYVASQTWRLVRQAAGGSSSAIQMRKSGGRNSSHKGGVRHISRSGWELSGFSSATGSRLRTARVIHGILWAAAGSLPIFGAFLPESSAGFAFQAAGNIWLGWYMLLAACMLTLHIIRGLKKLGRWMAANHRNAKMRRRRARANGGIFMKYESYSVKRPVRELSARAAVVLLIVCLALPTAGCAYGFANAKDIRVTQRTITIDKNAGNLQGMKIVLVTDLHLGVNSNIAMTRDMVAKINAQDPDLVLVGGDIFTSTYDGLKDPEAYEEALRKINAKYGVYAVYGNHDVVETLFGGFAVSAPSKAFRSTEMAEFMAASGFTVLEDNVVSIADGNVELIGRLDGEKAGDGTANRAGAGALIAEAKAESDGLKPIIVLEHEPMDLAALGKAGADLVLSGHTHDGQIFPGNLVVRVLSSNAYGVKYVDGACSLVSSGVGYYGPPMRIGTHSEIAVINLKFR